MRIRKRSQSLAPASTVTPSPPQLPISCKYQTAQLPRAGDSLLMRPGYSKVVAECSNMQEGRRPGAETARPDAVQDHDTPQSSSDVSAEPPVTPQSCLA